MIPRHTVFVSYHHANDEDYKREFERLFAHFYKALETRVVQDGDIDPSLPTDKIRNCIRDNFIRSATVTVVLEGSETWKRRHVDWEMPSSLRSTTQNSRTVLLGIILPSYPSSDPSEYTRYTSTQVLGQYRLRIRLDLQRVIQPPSLLLAGFTKHSSAGQKSTPQLEAVFH